ncbi:MAG: sugar phosphate isomerase/epimerase [Clostridia bacterium]|nr:sugar phosphate isomerase/epimerase [Clostridia bacterium]
MIIGAQFYTVREFCKTPEGVAETLKRVADIGYKAVQISGTCPLDPAWLKAELDKNGLICPLTHTKPDLITGKTDAVIEAHDIIGAPYVGLGYRKIQAEGEGYDGFDRIFRPSMEKIAAAGKKFMYHNHAMEFEKLDGTIILDTLAERYSPELLGFTLDTYWVKVGGYEPVDYIRKLAGRVDCVHFKDLGEEKRMEWVGNGTLDFAAIAAACADAGTKYVFVEQDNCNGESPFDCLKKSYDHIESLGLE